MDANKLLVSIVDDDDGVRKALLRLLSSHDLNAETFGSGQAFLDSLANRSPDCLILDLHMPEISGLNVLQHLSRIGLRVPTIIITAYDEPEAHCLAAGALAYLRKPIDEQVLLAAIESATYLSPRAGDLTGSADKLGRPSKRRSYSKASPPS